MANRNSSKFGEFMTLEYYGNKFNTLNMNRQRGHVSPHKVCMLLAVMDLIANGTIRNNRIFFDDVLRKRFSHYFNIYRTEKDRDNPHLPFFHLNGDGFWHHQPRPGKAAEYEALTTVGGPGVIQELIAYAYLDEALFQLLQRQILREYLNACLLQNFDNDQQRGLLTQGDNWDWIECEAIVADYFAMLDHELKGEAYNKAQYRRALQPKLNRRTEGSIEFKHQNISAVLIELGYPYITGYKPAFNYQQQLKGVIEVRLSESRESLVEQVNSFADQVPAPVDSIAWDSVLEKAPEMTPPETQLQTREFSPRHYNFAEREERNRRLGKMGEEFVINYERFRLSQCGRDDLAKEIEWTSEEKGDGAGFDIRSFNPDDEKELFIEVKTSKGGKYQPFYISENEADFSRLYSPQYSLYRVFDFKQQPRLFTLPGDIRKNVNLVVNTYKASF